MTYEHMIPLTKGIVLGCLCGHRLYNDCLFSISFYQVCTTTTLLLFSPSVQNVTTFGRSPSVQNVSEFGRHSHRQFFPKGLPTDIFSLSFSGAWDRRKGEGDRLGTGGWRWVHDDRPTTGSHRSLHPSLCPSMICICTMSYTDTCTIYVCTEYIVRIWTHPSHIRRYLSRTSTHVHRWSDTLGVMCGGLSLTGTVSPYCFVCSLIEWHSRVHMRFADGGYVVHR